MVAPPVVYVEVVCLVRVFVVVTVSDSVVEAEAVTWKLTGLPFPVPACTEILKVLELVAAWE